MALSKRLQGYGFTDQKLVDNFRTVLFQAHPDFGNYGRKEKQDAVAGLLKNLVPNFTPTLSMEHRQATINDLLEAMGEEQTYSLGEFGWDVGMPTLGGIVGGRVGSPVAGAGAGAILGEALKMRHERSVRGIEQEPFLDTMGKAAPVGLAEMAFQKGGNIFLDRLTNRVKRRAFLPRGGLSPESEITQRFLRQVPAAQGRFGRAFRWIYGHPALTESLTLGQLGAEERNFWAQMEAIAASGLFSGGLYERRIKAPLQAIQNIYKDTIDKLSTRLEPEQWGRLVGKTLQGEVDMAKLMRNQYWKRAKQFIEGRGVEIDIAPLVEFWEHEYGRRRRRDIGQIITKLNDFMGWNLKKQMSEEGGTVFSRVAPEEITQLPVRISAESSLDLWQALNSIRTKNNAGVIDKMTEKVRNPLLKTLKAVDEDAYNALTVANEFHKKSAKKLLGEKGQAKISQTMLKKLVDDAKPGAIVNFLHSGQNLADRTASLRSLRNVYLDAYKRRGAPLHKVWEREVQRPLRYKILMSAYDEKLGQFRGDLLRSELKRLGAEYGPEGLDLQRTMKSSEYLDMVFGRDMLKRIDDLAVALDKASTSPSGQAIIMKILQARAFSGIAAEGLTPTVTRDLTVLALGPVYLLNILTNKRLLAELTQGLEHGPRSTQLNRVLATLTRMQTQSYAERRKFTQEELNFYEGMIDKITGATSDVSFPVGP